jgi:pimeloyl-ACP methyl ester carboxylesterase
MSDMDMIDTSYREAGNAGTWIMLRGLGRESAHWMEFVAQLRQRIPECRIECIDWPGNGEYAHSRSPCTIADGVAHLRQVCVERQLKPPYVLVGISMGGMAAIDWLAHFPEEITHAHVINTSIGGISYWYERMRIGSLLKLLTSARTVRGRERAVAEVTLSPVSVNDAIIDHWVTIAANHPVVRSNLLRQIWSASHFSLRRPEYADRLTVYVSGEDRLVNPECSRDMARLWNVELVEHATAGHDLPLDDGDWLLEQLLRERRPLACSGRAEADVDADLLVHLHRSLACAGLAGWSTRADRG